MGQLWQRDKGMRNLEVQKRGKIVYEWSWGVKEAVKPWAGGQGGSGPGNPMKSESPSQTGGHKGLGYAQRVRVDGFR